MNTTPSANAAPAAASKEKRMPQLDALRAFAVMGVMWFHWVPEYQFGLPWASGVSLFFVLSGFLITGILFEARSRTDSRWWSLRQFYARRIIRIWPIFYLTIGVGVLLNVHHVRDVWGWHAAYLTNFLTALKHYRAGPFQHFWSLAVEEQFYICWPLIMLFIPRKRILPFIVLTIIASPIFRIYMVLQHPEIVFWHMLPFSCLDMLGIGALLAYFAHFETVSTAAADRTVAIFGWVGIPLSIVIGGYRVLRHGELPLVVDALRSFAISLCFAWLVYNAAKGFRGPLGRLLENKWLAAIGKISYGLYVYHLFVPVMVDYVFAHTSLPEKYASHPVILRVLMYAVITWIIAGLSWVIIERPVNSLKRFFPYARKINKAAAPMAPQPAVDAV